ncbi:MAG: hypothetical protein NVS3B21_14030 [Acidimicrobiales bacterium]
MDSGPLRERLAEMDAGLIERRADAASSATASELEGRRTSPTREQRWWAAGPVAVGVAPFVLLFVALVADRPSITSYGDRAVTSLAVRDLLGGRQLLGAYSRYGWHHPGPVFFIPLAVAHTLVGGAPWALDAGMIGVSALWAGLLLWLVSATCGWRAGMLSAAAVGLYLNAVGFETFRDPWNPWGLLLPLAVLLVLAGVAGTGSPLALAGATVVATVLVQTHVGAAPVALIVFLVAAVLHWRTRRSSVTPPPFGPASASALAVAALLWVPPVLQQATGADPNLSELWKFFAQGGPGHNLSTAVATLGDRLRLVPFGSHSRLLASSPSVGWGKAWTGLLTVALSVVVGVGLAVGGRRVRNPFAGSIGLATVAALCVSILAIRSIQGPLDGFLVAWTTAIPLAQAVAAASLIAGSRRAAPPDQSARASRRRARDAAIVLIATAAVLLASGSALMTPSARIEDAATVRAAWVPLAAYVHDNPGGDVLLRVNDPYAWPIEAGLALLVEQHGGHAHVTDDWTFMFGDPRRTTGDEMVVADLRAVGEPRPGEAVRVSVTDHLDAESLASVTARIGTLVGRAGARPKPPPPPPSFAGVPPTP